MPTKQGCNCNNPSIMDELMKMSLEDLIEVQQALEKRIEAKQNEAKTKAYNDFVNAYRNFRSICPYDIAHVTVEDEEIGDIEIDLYEYLDIYLEHEV